MRMAEIRTRRDIVGRDIPSSRRSSNADIGASPARLRASPDRFSQRLNG
jgi:hypothetical protein